MVELWKCSTKSKNLVNVTALQLGEKDFVRGSSRGFNNDEDDDGKKH